MRKSSILVLSLCLIQLACTPDTATSNNKLELKKTNLFLSEPDVKKLSPIKFLEALKYKDNTPKDYFSYHNDSIPTDWVKKEHLLTLIKELDNNELAHPVVSIYASIMLGSHGLSTIGNEAYYLLLSYRTKNYPPYSTSNLGSNENDTTKLSIEDKNEMLDWWESLDSSKHDFK